MQHVHALPSKYKSPKIESRGGREVGGGHGVGGGIGVPLPDEATPIPVSEKTSISVTSRTGLGLHLI